MCNFLPAIGQSQPSSGSLLRMGSVRCEVLERWWSACAPLRGAASGRVGRGLRLPACLAGRVGIVYPS